MPKPILKIESLKFRYPEYPGLRTEELFRNINMNIYEGEIVLILGRPESGKTTLSRILLGLVPRFTGGELKGDIILNDRSILSCKPFNLLEDIGIVFQNPEEQLFSTRCDTEVSFALESLGLPRTQIYQRVEESLNQVGLSAYTTRSPDSLSGGEKRKLLLACLISVDPLIWMLDETLEELDTQSKVRILNFFKNEKKTALIFAAKWHNLYSKYISRIYLLSGSGAEDFKETPDSPGFLSKLSEKGFFLSDYRQDVETRRKITRGRVDSPIPILHVKNLCFHYPDQGGFSINIDELNIYPGKILSIIGENGSGKSTLAKLLCGLLLPQSGEIKINRERKFVTASQMDLNSYTGYMFQNPDYQIFLPNVREELAYGLKMQNQKYEAINTKVIEAISVFNLPAPDSPPTLMSYGARKRLQAAVYYLLDRPLLIIDEGDSGLSADEFEHMVEQLFSPEKGLIIITHDIEMARLYSDQLICMKDGRIREALDRETLW